MTAERSHFPEDRLPTWVELLDLITALLAGLWVPLKFGLLNFPRATDIGVDLLFLPLSGACAWYVLRRSLGGPSRGGRGQRLALRIRFLLDLAVALPLVTLASQAGFDVLPFWCLKLVAVRHLLRFAQILYRLGIPHPALGRLISLVAIVPLMVHWAATGWILIGGDATSGDLSIRYIRAVYWAITTMATVGYGDITPQTPPQMLYACGVMVVGVGFFGFVLGNVASLLARLDAAKVRQEEIRDRVETFMRYHRVRPPLRRRVRDYFNYLWDSRCGYDDELVLASLPANLRTELSLCVNRELVESVPLLKGASPELIRELVQELKPLVAVPGEDLFRHGAPGNEMYFILHGEVEIISPTGERLAGLQDGSFFGEMALLTNNPRSATARTTSYCDLYTLERHAFEGAIERYPDFAAQVADQVRARANS